RRVAGTHERVAAGRRALLARPGPIAGRFAGEHVGRRIAMRGRTGHVLPVPARTLAVALAVRAAGGLRRGRAARVTGGWIRAVGQRRTDAGTRRQVAGLATARAGRLAADTVRAEVGKTVRRDGTGVAQVLLARRASPSGCRSAACPASPAALAARRAGARG